MTARSAEVVVIGGGPAGLAAAWSCARRGLEVELVEAAPDLGGLAASFDVAGIRVDHGSHRLHPNASPVVLDTLRALLGTDLQVRPRHGRIRLQGHWVGFPLQARDMVRHLPPSFALGAGVDALAGPFRHARADTFAEEVRVGLGPTVLRSFYGPYARKLWGVGPDELDGDVARRRVAARSAGAVLRRVRAAARPDARTFLYPRRGFGQIPEALADAASGAGARLGTGRRVVAMAHHGGRWVLDLDTADGARSVEAGVVISTVPSPVLARVVRGVPEPVRQAASGMAHRGMVLVYLVLDRTRWSEFDAHYLPGPEFTAARVSEPRNYRDGDDPDGRTVLCAEVPCTVGDRRWAADDVVLGAQVAAELERAGLPTTPTAVAARRLPHVYPVQPVGYAGDRDRVERWADALPGLVSIGRGGRFTADNTHHVLAEGLAAGSLVRADGSLDRPGLAHLRGVARGFVVED